MFGPLALTPHRPKVRRMTSRTPSVGKGRPSGGRRLIKSRRCSTTNRSRRRYTAKAHATRPGKGKSRSRRCLVCRSRTVRARQSTLSKVNAATWRGGPTPKSTGRWRSRAGRRKSHGRSSAGTEPDCWNPESERAVGRLGKPDMRCQAVAELRGDIDQRGMHAAQGLGPQFVPELVVITQVLGVDADAGCL